MRGGKHRLTDQQAQEFINRYICGEHPHKLGKEYGLRRSATKNLLSGRTYRNLYRPVNMQEIIDTHPFGKIGIHRKLTPENAQKAIDRYIAGESPQKIADNLNVNRETITAILHCRDWKQLQRPADLESTFELRRKLKKKYYRQPLPPLTEHQKNIIVGSLLGDGHIAKFYSPQGESNFSKQQINLDHIEWVHKELFPYSLPQVYRVKPPSPATSLNSNYFPFKEVEPGVIAYQTRTTTHEVFTELRNKWYPNNIKIVPDDLQLNAEILAIWFVDDGCNCPQVRQARLATQGFTFSEVERLQQLLSGMGIHCSVRKDKYPSGYKPFLSFDGDGYDALLQTITPLIPWLSFAYKIQHRPRTYKCPIFSEIDKMIIFRMKSKGKSIAEICRKFNVGHSSISNLLKEIGTSGSI